MKARVVESASGPNIFLVKGEIVTSNKSEAGGGVSYLPPLDFYNLRKHGCLRIIEESKPKAKPAKRPLKSGKISIKDSKGE